MDADLAHTSDRPQFSFLQQPVKPCPHPLLGKAGLQRPRAYPIGLLSRPAGGICSCFYDCPNQRERTATQTLVVPTNGRNLLLLLGGAGLQACMDLAEDDRL